MTNASGGIEEESDYYPYGGERIITHTLADQHYKFNGKERDPETGFDDFGARFYSSAWGRWLTPDWSADPTPVPYAQLDNPQSLNLYAYVRNNPTTFSDLDGHEPGSGNVQCSGGDGHCADTETPNEADADLRTWMDETKAELASMGAKGPQPAQAQKPGLLPAKICTVSIQAFRLAFFFHLAPSDGDWTITNVRPSGKP